MQKCITYVHLLKLPIQTPYSNDWYRIDLKCLMANSFNDIYYFGSFDKLFNIIFYIAQSFYYL